MKQTKWNQPHEYEPAGAIDFRGEVLCHCGLPPDSGLHKQKHQDQTKPKVSEWERELEKIPASLISPDGDGCEWESISGLKEYEQLKSFIQSLLDQQKAEMVEMVRGMEAVDTLTGGFVNKNHDSGYRKGYNQALDDILEKLEEME